MTVAGLNSIASGMVMLILILIAVQTMGAVTRIMVRRRIKLAVFVEEVPQIATHLLHQPIHLLLPAIHLPHQLIPIPSALILQTGMTVAGLNSIASGMVMLILILIAVQTMGAVTRIMVRRRIKLAVFVEEVPPKAELELTTVVSMLAASKITQEKGVEYMRKVPSTDARQKVQYQMQMAKRQMKHAVNVEEATQ